MRRPRHCAVVVGAAVFGIGLAAWLTWFLVGAIQVRDGLAWAKTEIKAGHHAPARDRLSWLSRWWPENGEVDYLLGTCESALGQPSAALTAWQRVPVSSPLATAAALARGRALASAQGRFREAEAAYRTALRGRGPRATEARWGLAMLLLWEGRLDEVRQVLDEIWRTGERRDRIAALRELWRLDSVVVAAEELEPMLKKAERFAPADDRAWLARAYLATRIWPP